MGKDAQSGVCDEFGRTFDHENLFVVGAPTTVSGSCCNATLTFVALGLRAATEIGKTLPPRPPGHSGMVSIAGPQPGPAPSGRPAGSRSRYHPSPPA
jgi:choline dehydrogenase-like flavoprotein